MSIDTHTACDHSFDGHRFVYPALSRRSHGISVGVNLNPDRRCNFDCVYCQIDRTELSETRFVELGPLLNELLKVLEAVTSQSLFDTERFHATPAALRRLNDIAFAGDGEPTTYRNFEEIVSECAAIKRKLRLDDVRMVLITNASMFHRPHIQRGLEVLYRNNGEIWAKLDAGTDDYYQTVDRSPIPFRRILNNLLLVSRMRPIVVQSLFMRINGEPPSPSELSAFCDRLNEIIAGGGQISLVQIYTIARRPAEQFVQPLANAEVDAIVNMVRGETGLNSEPFYGHTSWDLVE